VLPLSHDEVVYGKRSLLEKMPGDDWQKFANLRLLYAAMWTQPGKKLLFMGGELAQRQEWSHDRSLDWHLLREPWHRAISLCVGELNRLYREEPALHVYDDEAAGFEWIDGSNTKESVLTFLRKGTRPSEDILVALNFTPVPRDQYRVGVPRSGKWKEIFNSDARELGGSGWGNLGALEATPVPWNGRRFSLNLTLPPLGAVMLKCE
jgi:1,4-alpha-glucan branching enzyme